MAFAKKKREERTAPTTAPTPANHKIFLFSANCENLVFDDYQLGIIKTKIATYDPDIIVLAVQEAKSHSDEGSLPKRLFKKLNGVTYKDNQTTYTDEEKRKIIYHHHSNLRNKKSGMTKFKWNYHQISVLYKSSVNIDHQSTRNFQSSGGGKGSTGVYCKINGKHCAFMGAHLDSHDGTYDPDLDNGQDDNGVDLPKGGYKEHTNKINSLSEVFASLSTATTVTTPRRTWISPSDLHTSFLMGDLNFRLQLHDPKTDASNKTVAEMGTLIADTTLNGGRDTLWQLDSFNKIFFDSIDQDSILRGYNFPKPSPLYLPTYKRAFKTQTDKEKIAILAAATAPTAAQIKPVYFKGKAGTDKPLSARAGYYELGWLDRIGYKCAPSANIRNVAQFSFDEIDLADHVPVGMTCEITV